MTIANVVNNIYQDILEDDGRCLGQSTAKASHEELDPAKVELDGDGAVIHASHSAELEDDGGTGPENEAVGSGDSVQPVGDSNVEYEMKLEDVDTQVDQMGDDMQVSDCDDAMGSDSKPTTNDEGDNSDSVRVETPSGTRAVRTVSSSCAVTDSW